MPFSRPSLTELRQMTAADINAALPGVDALLRFSNLGILGDVLAGLANGQFGYLDWIALQAVPFTATGEFLEGWAALKGITRQTAGAAAGVVSFVATTGAVVPAGTVVNRTDGVAYVTSANATAIANAVACPVVASAGGASGNAAAGTSMALGTGISGVASTGSVSTALIGGTDVETDPNLRSRMLAAYAAPAQGGALADYVTWALDVPGVTRAWVKPNAMGPGTVTVLFMMDSVEAAHGGFPQGTTGCSSFETRGATATGDQLALADALFALQPVTAQVYTAAPIPNTISLTIAGIAGASSTTQAAIGGAAAAALLAGSAPGGLTNVSAIEAAIAAVPGSEGFVITGITASAGTVTLGAAGNIQSNAGALPRLGAVIYQ
jgi:uncharacterized phage protein gp47/JayE